MLLGEAIAGHKVSTSQMVIRLELPWDRIPMLLCVILYYLELIIFSPQQRVQTHAIKNKAQLLPLI